LGSFGALSIAQRTPFHRSTSGCRLQPAELQSPYSESPTVMHALADEQATLLNEKSNQTPDL
jgi:hypothetical protein